MTHLDWQPSPAAKLGSDLIEERLKARKRDAQVRDLQKENGKLRSVIELGAQMLKDGHYEEAGELLAEGRKI